jgi:hypothetical protein
MYVSTYVSTNPKTVDVSGIKKYCRTYLFYLVKICITRDGLFGMTWKILENNGLKINFCIFNIFSRRSTVCGRRNAVVLYFVKLA